MAISLSTVLFPDNSTDANFRAWVQFVHDLLITTGGWVDPGDTGQLNIAAAAHPIAANTKVGYRIYRMDDTLQATSPVFMRLDYGSSATANQTGIWVTIGTATDGAGTIPTANMRFNGGSSSTPQITSAGGSSAEGFTRGP